MNVCVTIEDSRHNGVRPSHFDGVRMACDAFGVETIEIIDATEDGWYPPGGQPRYATFDAFAAAHPGESIALLDAAGADISTLSSYDWVVVGSSSGHSAEAKVTYTSVAITLPVPAAIEGRDALMIALAEC